MYCCQINLGHYSGRLPSFALQRLLLEATSAPSTVSVAEMLTLNVKFHKTLRQSSEWCPQIPIRILC